jgi:hypothetical protein
MSQATLLVLMVQGLVEQSEVEQKVCPVVLRLTEMDNLMMEFHTGAVAVRAVCWSAYHLFLCEESCVLGYDATVFLCNVRNQSHSGIASCPSWPESSETLVRNLKSRMSRICFYLYLALCW